MMFATNTAMNLRKLALALLLFTPFVKVSAQQQYDDLLILYVDEHYEKCVDRAERYTKRKATRRDPLPYLYASMCYFEMSRISKYQEMDEYKRADREALKWAGKFRRKDKHLEFFPNYQDYWTDLNTMAQEVGLNFMDEKAYSKARLQFKRMVRYNPENPGAWKMLALAQEGMRSKREAQESSEKFEEVLAEIPDIGRLPVDQRKLLRAALIYSAEELIEEGRLDSAREVIGIGEGHFMDNPEFKAIHDEVASGR